MRIVGEVNKYVTDQAPFKLKAESERERLGTILHVARPGRQRLQHPALPVPAAQRQRRARGLRRRGRRRPDAAHRGGRRPRRRRAEARYPIITGDYSRDPRGSRGRSRPGRRWPSRRRSSPSSTPRSSTTSWRGWPATSSPSRPAERAPGTGARPRGGAVSGRPPAPAPLPIAVVDNHTHLDIAATTARPPDLGGRDRRSATRGRASTGWCRSGCDLPSARFTAACRRRAPGAARRRWPCTPTRRRGWPSRGELAAALGRDRAARGAPADPGASVRPGSTTSAPAPKALRHSRTRSAGTSTWPSAPARRCRSTTATPTRTCCASCAEEGAPRSHRPALLLGRHRRWPASASTRGYYLSFAGTVTFKNAQGLRNALAVTPLEQVLGRDRRAVPDAEPAPRGDQRAVPRAAHRPGDGRRPQRRRPAPLHGHLGQLGARLRPLVTSPPPLLLARHRIGLR